MVRVNVHLIQSFVHNSGKMPNWRQKDDSARSDSRPFEVRQEGEGRGADGDNVTNGRCHWKQQMSWSFIDTLKLLTAIFCWNTRMHCRHRRQVKHVAYNYSLRSKFQNASDKVRVS